MRVTNNVEGVGAQPSQLINIGLEVRSTDPDAPLVGRRVFFRSDTREMVILGAGVRLTTGPLGEGSADGQLFTVALGSFATTLTENINYRVVANFEPHAFGDQFFQTLLKCDDPSVVISEELNSRTLSRASWLVYFKNTVPYTQTANVTLTGSAKGSGWTGPNSVVCTWTLEVIG